MNIQLPYGEAGIPIDVPDNWINGRCYRSSRLQPAGDIHAELMTAFQEPVGVESLEEMMRAHKTCAVVVDSQHPTLLTDLLSPLLEQLEDLGSLSSDSIRVLLTNSVWQPLSQSDVDRLVPDSVRSHYRVELHDPSDLSRTQEVGTQSESLRLRINSSLMESELRVLVGPVVPDLIFGFSGTRSLIVPGMAHESTIKSLYSYENTSKKTVAYGNVLNNPFHLLASEAMISVGCDLAIAPLMTGKGEISEILAGHPAQLLFAAINKVREKMSVRIKEPMDIVITCGGGSPFDSGFLNLVNALSSALPILKMNGTIVAAAALDRGLGEPPLRDLLLESGGPRSFCEALEKNSRFTPGQWIAHRYFELIRRHEVILYSEGVPEDEIWKAGMTPTQDLQEAVEVAMQGHGQRCKICAIPDGPLALSELAGGQAP